MGPSRTTSRSSSRRLMSQKLLRVSPEEFDILSDPQLDSDSTDFYDAAPMDLEQPWPYRFEPNEYVWVRTAGGNWRLGRVDRLSPSRKGQTRASREGIFFPVVFNTTGSRIRKYFAPLNGDIKPDTPPIRHLLIKAGWLDQDQQED